MKASDKYILEYALEYREIAYKHPRHPGKFLNVGWEYVIICDEDFREAGLFYKTSQTPTFRKLGEWDIEMLETYGITGKLPGFLRKYYGLRKQEEISDKLIKVFHE